MSNDELLRTVTERAQKWLGPEYDEETRKEVKRMLTPRTRQNLSNRSIKIWSLAQAVFAASWVPAPTA